ncbi:MAG: glycosyltransferase [bacterium]|nr:MAG: glycosyltransferase [bacterium]
MNILIDARLYGPKDTGIGRYTQKLVDNLSKIDSSNVYYILLRKDDYESLKFPNNWTKILADFKHYSFAEQFKLPLLLTKLKPDLVHFPHFNVPLFYFGKYVVTIHDLIMHKFAGGEATTRKFPIYQIWRLGYYIAFAKAIYGSTKIIVPSQAVKNEVVNYYKIQSNKVEVTYEG